MAQVSKFVLIRGRTGTGSELVGPGKTFEEGHGEWHAVVRGKGLAGLAGVFCGVCGVNLLAGAEHDDEEAAAAVVKSEGHRGLTVRDAREKWSDVRLEEDDDKWVSTVDLFFFRV